MSVDVLTTIEIERPQHEVAAFASDPGNATSWYENIKSIEWIGARTVAVGAQVAFRAVFLGRQLSYTYRIEKFVPDELLVMRTDDGPFPMETTYTWEESPSGGTRMSLLNRGEPSGFGRVASPFMAHAMRQANRKDLRRLKQLLEERAAG